MTDTTFYLLYGDDNLSLSEALKKIRESMGDSSEADMNTSEYDGENTSIAKILNDAQIISLFG